MIELSLLINSMTFSYILLVLNIKKADTAHAV